MEAATLKPLTAVFEGWIAATIDEEGVSIPHGLLLDQHDQLTMIALAVPVPDAYRVMLFEILQRDAKEAIFAFDRFTKPGQGTELGDLVAGHHFEAGNWRPFIVEYQHDPRIVQPMNWTNAFWNSALRVELAGHMLAAGLAMLGTR